MAAKFSASYVRTYCRNEKLSEISLTRQSASAAAADVRVGKIHVT